MRPLMPWQHPLVGFRQPIVVDEQGVIVVGHTRYQAALKLGLLEPGPNQCVPLTAISPTGTRVRIEFS
jgi:hypothetical protein